MRAIKNVLSVEQLAAWRREGLTYAEIGKRVGFSDATAAAYGQRVLPKELQGRIGRRKKPAKKPTPADRCSRCKLASEPKRPVDPETGLCLWCEKEQAGEDLREFCESGQAVAELGEENCHRHEQIKAELRKAVEERRNGRRQERPSKAVQVVPAGEAGPPLTEARDLIVRALPAELLHEGIFIATGGNGTAAALIAGPGGLEELLQQRRAEKVWTEFLAAAGDGLGDLPLARAVPPAYVRTDGDRWEYLRQIAAGRVHVAGGWRVRRRLKRVLARQGRPVLGRGTARALEILASAAHWMVARERRT